MERWPRERPTGRAPGGRAPGAPSVPRGSGERAPQDPRRGARFRGRHGRHGPPPGRGPAPRTRGAHRDPRSRGHAGISRAAGRGAAAARRRRGAPHALAREGGPRHGGGGDRGTARRLHGRPAEPRRPKRRRFLRARAPEIPGGHPRLPEARLHAGRRESRGPQHAPGALGEVRLRLEHGRGPERGPLVRAERLGRPQSGHSSLRRRAAPSRAVDRDRRRHRARRSLLFEPELDAPGGSKRGGRGKGMSIAAKRHMLLGRDYFERGFYQDAIRELLEAVRLNPNFPDLHNQLGLALSMNGDRRHAAEEFRRALELNPNYVEARLNLAIVLNEMGQYEDALREFNVERLRDHEQENLSAEVRSYLAESHMMLGDTYRNVGVLVDASQEYRKALKLSPQYLDIKNKLGATYCEMGLYQDAETELEEALAQNPRYVAARVTLGVVLLRSGRKTRAREEWEKCLALEPENIRARAYLDMMEREASTEESRAR
ncbi:MAG: tetratricopeptide repeat protein [Candidatus Eisenbacteria bacterium]|uniref:Tetratricopeptide repeat protein n=2 Tax=Eiseniibacteriota bacterium TaxID=2212470 RepID=A0A538SAR4_UNCEI|nr:MAG: tetratricopeptide repeat protein [Candidatus Eisenbacteria bacterium]